MKYLTGENAEVSYPELLSNCNFYLKFAIITIYLISQKLQLFSLIYYPLGTKKLPNAF